MSAVCDRRGGLPSGLFVNSLTAFEGVLGHFTALPPEAFAQTTIGCYDYDPFAAYLQFPVHMVRQDAHGLMTEAYRLLDSQSTEITLHQVPPQLIAPRTFYDDPFSDRG